MIQRRSNLLKPPSQTWKSHLASLADKSFTKNKASIIQRLWSFESWNEHWIGLPCFLKWSLCSIIQLDTTLCCTGPILRDTETKSEQGQSLLVMKDPWGGSFEAHPDFALAHLFSVSIGSNSQYVPYWSAGKIIPPSESFPLVE